MNKIRLLFSALLIFGVCNLAQSQCGPDSILQDVIVEFDLTGQMSDGLFGDATNNIFQVCDPNAAGIELTTIEVVDINFDTENGSWCSEQVFTFLDDTGAPIGFTPSVQGSPSPCADLPTSLAPFNTTAGGFTTTADANGCVTFVFFETFDDAGGNDATYTSGNIILVYEDVCVFDVANSVIPTMGEWGLMSLGILLLIVGVVTVRQQKLILD